MEGVVVTGQAAAPVVTSISLLAFACGAPAVARRAEHRRGLCYQDMAEDGLVAGAECPPRR